jgi:predicted CopG family antitoxin
MKNLTITISDAEFEKLGINKETLSFSELFEIIKDEISKQNLNVVTELAGKYGISEMTLEEINEEIKAVRDAKNNS